MVLSICDIANGVQLRPLPPIDSTGLKSRTADLNIASDKANEALASPCYTVWSSL